MKKILINYSGAILLYSTIIFGVIILNARFKYLNQLENNNERVSYELALGDENAR